MLFVGKSYGECLMCTSYHSIIRIFWYNVSVNKWDPGCLGQKVNSRSLSYGQRCKRDCSWSADTQDRKRFGIVLHVLYSYSVRLGYFVQFVKVLFETTSGLQEKEKKPHVREQLIAMKCLKELRLVVDNEVLYLKDQIKNTQSSCL